MKYLYFTFLLCYLLITTSCNLQDEKKRDSKRVSKLFNDEWFFITDSLSKGESSAWYLSINRPAHIRKVTLPHTWNVEKGTEEFYGNSWYFKDFEVKDHWKGKVIRLKFNAVNRDAKIWINGKLLEDRIGAGYTPFEIDISQTLTYNDVNFIAIKVSNQYSNLAIPYLEKFDWPNDGGIIRNVELIKTDPPSIRYIHVNPKIKRKGNGKILVEIGIIEGLKSIAKNIDVWFKIDEYNQKTSNTILEGNRKVKGYDSKCFLELDVTDIKPWHFSAPNMYTLTVAIGQKMILTDIFKTNFGFRSLKTEGNKLILNGEPVRLPGLEWMPGSFPESGMAESREQMVKMLELLKNTNAVLTRFHWQQDDFIFDWCDRNGILIQEEIPLWQWPAARHINDTIKSIGTLHVKEMVHNHYNHPSIIAWGVGNELSAQDEKVKRLIDFAYTEIVKIDSGRLINYVSNTLQQDPLNDGTNIGDVIMWNDYTGLWYNISGNGLTKEMLPQLLYEFNRSTGNKPIIISEYGLCEPIFEGGDPVRIELMKYHMSIYEQTPFVAGAIYFSLNDYRTHMGEVGEGKMRRRIHGVVDLEGNKKPSYDSLRILFSPIKRVEIGLKGNVVQITGKNHDGIPSYTLIGYKISLSNIISGEIIAEREIPIISPGTSFNIVINNFMEREFKISITSPNGYSVFENDYLMKELSAEDLGRK